MRAAALVRGALRRVGLDIMRWPAAAPRELACAPADLAIWEKVHKFTMVDLPATVTLISASRYLVRAGVPGAFVECGVWRGGQVMAMAYTLLEERAKGALRPLWLYDTFEGMVPPEVFDGQHAAQRYAEAGSQWCRAGEVEVRHNLARTGYPERSLRFLVGRVEETLLRVRPDRIALLRLDTDWYASTKAELEALYPLLSHGGILIVDDYGRWPGCKRAVDDYFDSVPAALPFQVGGSRWVVKVNS